jgi:hypothetical protein
MEGEAQHSMNPVPFLMKEDKALDPVDVSFLRPAGIVLDPQHFTDLVEQRGFGIGHDPGAGDVVRAKPFGLGEVVALQRSRITLGNMKTRVTAIIESFEAEEITEAEALAKLQEVTERVVDAGWLRHYWNSESLEDFVDRLCATPIADWQQLRDDDALRLIAEYFQTGSRGHLDSIEEALERRFGKPTGTRTHECRTNRLQATPGLRLGWQAITIGPAFLSRNVRPELVAPSSNQLTLSSAPS